MHYPPGWMKEKENQNRALRISINDWIICYIQEKTIGGIGQATSRVYQGSSWINRLNYDFETRVNVNWQFSSRNGYQIPNNVKISDLLGIDRLHTHTVHEMEREQFESTRNLIQVNFN